MTTPDTTPGLPLNAEPAGGPVTPDACGIVRSAPEPGERP